MPKIHFNGQEYDSPEAMPPEVRKLFELATGMLADGDGDGRPDIFQNLMSNMTTITSATQFVIDGKTYASIEEMPPEVRKQYGQLIAHVDANRDGVPDMLEGGVIQSSVALGGRMPAPTAPSGQPAQPQLVKVVGEQGGQSGMLMVAALVILVLVGVVIYLLLMR